MAATTAGNPPFAKTLTQPLCPSSDSLIFRAFFSSNLHFVALCDANKKASKMSNHVQCPIPPTTNPMNVAAATPAESSILALDEPIIRPRIIIPVTIKLP